MSQDTVELEVFKRACQNFKLVFDVGTRDDLDYYYIHPNCEYHLFEPDIDSINSLNNKISNIKNYNNNIRTNKFGLSDIAYDNCPYYKNTQSYVQHWQGLSIDTGIKYPLQTLDQYVEQNNIDNIDFIKIDCEESDEKIIAGGLDTLKKYNKVSYLQFEYSKIAHMAKLLDNFDLYIMMTQPLVTAVNNLNITFTDFNVSLVKLTDEIINVFDNRIWRTGPGGNIFCINKYNKCVDPALLMYRI